MAETFSPAEPVAPADPSDAPDDPGARVLAAIRHWRDAVIANGPIARSTACWNQLDAALEPLAAAICKEI